MVVDARWWTRNFAVVGLGIEVDDRQVRLEEMDAWNKRLALDSIFIQVIRMTVGRRHQDDSVGH